MKKKGERFLKWVTASFGPAAIYLRDRYILVALVGVGAALPAVGPLLFVTADAEPDRAWTPVYVASAILAVLAALSDKVADSYAAEQTKRQLRRQEDAENKLAIASEIAAERGVRALITFQGSVIEIGEVAAAQRPSHLLILPGLMTICATEVVGQAEARATYYRAEEDDDGWRTLVAARQHVGHSRTDLRDQPFVEKAEPHHAMWEVLDGSDLDVQVFSYGDPVPDFDWDRKVYKTFLNVPVRHGDTKYGVLSVNSSAPGSIAGTQVAILTAMARTMALALACGPQPTTRPSTEAVSDAAVTVEPVTPEEPQ